VAPIFLEGEKHRGHAASVPYFVALGSIEPRKNHKLLLKVWERLAAGDGEVPKLVIAGTPWRDIDGIAATVRRSPALRRSVILAAGLTSTALCRLLRGAQALLQPSLVEGFGLPIVEALAQGTPVIASDQPAHREAGGNFAVYLDAGDQAAWESAIRGQLSRRSRVAGYRPWDWTQYGAVIAPFLAEVAARPRYASLS
jgi:glycosyltransferase involved in cell wall biosynthesis